MAKGNKILASAGILFLGAAIVTGATYALFTGKSTVNNHLQAGTISVGLWRTNYRENVLNEQGLLDVKENGTDVDLVKDGSKVFAADGAVPGSWYEATVEVKNVGSIAFEYGVRILWDEKNADETEKEFASQMEITVTYGNQQSQTFLLSESKGKDIGVGKLLKNESDSFTVTAEFLEDENNDKVQNESIEFDLQVYATQSTGK